MPVLEVPSSYLACSSFSAKIAEKGIRGGRGSLLMWVSFAIVVLRIHQLRVRTKRLVVYHFVVTGI